jgi:hypothetical protein
LFAPPWGGSGGLGGGLCFPFPTPGTGSKRAGWRRSGAIFAFFGAVCFEPDASRARLRFKVVMRSMTGGGAAISLGLTVSPFILASAIIIHGASGGVGARVLATASGEDGAALVRRLGADAAINGRRDDIAAAARDFAPDGVDAVLALAGGDPLERCLDALRSGGRLAYLHWVEPEPKKRQGIAIIAYDAIAGVAEFEHLNGAVEEAKLQVPIAAEYALKESEMADPHLNMIRDVVPSADGCEDCLRIGSWWVHLRLCLTCGHVGCCDSSPHRHARQHFHHSGHPIIQSFEPGEDWRWCYVDQAEV